LFFADAAILVEGPAERILVPQFVRNNFPELTQSYITMLEIGGSHAHRLRPLIEHLGLVTLVIADLDSMSPTGSAVPPARGEGHVTGNTTLKSWLPEKDSLDDLLDATVDQKIRIYDNFSVRVAYQFPLQVQLNDSSSSGEALPNTFEDALAYDNLQVFRNIDSNGAIKKIREAINKAETIKELQESMFNILKATRKAELALDLLELDQDPWPIVPPSYIQEGLSWLEQQLRRKQKELSVSVVPIVASTEVAK
jgi:hypothetical protein